MATIKVGDQVHWTVTSGSRRSFSMRRREGKVISIVEGIACVKTGSKRFASVVIGALTLDGQPGLLDHTVRAIRANATGTPDGPATWPGRKEVADGHQN